MTARNSIIPVFVPHLGCPNDCVFCNQRRISGHIEPATAQTVKNAIEEAAALTPSGTKRQLAFYGGSFTAIPEAQQLELFEEKLLSPQSRSRIRMIGQVFDTYWLAQFEDKFYIIDQHAAHERIMYEKVKENYYSDIAKDSQMLLLPDVVTLTHKEMDVAKENKEMFEQAGFYFEEFGENTIKLTGVPTVCIDLDTKELFLETLDEINTVARTAKQEKEEKFIATVACKAAVKANMALTREEVEKLMEQLLKLPNPFTCPHGRPTVIKMTKYDIERKFARK